MESEINRVVQRLFPEALIEYESFEDWCSMLRQDVQPGAADLVARLEQHLELAKLDCRTKCDPRGDCWERFGGEGDQLIKSATSIRSKLARDLMTEKVIAERKTVEFLRLKILEFGDLGRVRLVADFPSDVLCLQEKLFIDGKFLGLYECPKGIKDFVFDPTKRDGLKGHRARQFSVRIPMEASSSFGLEVQLMTRLQHAWDRRNHPFYEWQREHPSWAENQAAVELAVNDFACAEALHLVDRQADQNWQELQKFIRKEHAE